MQRYVSAVEEHLGTLQLKDKLIAAAEKQHELRSSEVARLSSEGSRLRRALKEQRSAIQEQHQALQGQQAAYSSLQETMRKQYEASANELVALQGRLADAERQSQLAQVWSSFGFCNLLCLHLP